MKEGTEISNFELKMIGRDFMTISGITKLTGFDANEFLMSSVLGNIYLTGENLELVNLNSDDGIIKIQGKIDSYAFIDKKKRKESIVSKLFK